MVRTYEELPPVESGLEEKPVDVKAMAEYLAVSADTVRVYAHTGDVPSFKIGNRLRFYVSEVRAHLTRPMDPWAAPRSRRRSNPVVARG